MTALALLLIGYSFFCALALALTHFRGSAYAEQAGARALGLALMAAMLTLQALHLARLYWGLSAVASPAYRMALFAVAPCFYGFCRNWLSANAAPAQAWPAWRWALHALPVLASVALAPAVALPLAFLIGAGYLAALAKSLLALREERARFRLEMALLAFALVLGLVVAALALAAQALPNALFFKVYAAAIGLAFFLAQLALALRPQLPVEVKEAAHQSAAYAHSTLAKVDCPAALARLEQLMAQERFFQDPDLSLASLAARLQLSTHQCSELVNSRLGKGFARYLRELRVQAAKAMLVAEPKASVLSVGLSVGFTSQSSFYEAFREIEGSTPGQFRKLQSITQAPESPNC